MKHLFFLIFFLIPAYYSSQEYKFNIFTQEEGLPQPYVYDIVQAKNGFLYAATGDGLGYYTGNTFKKINSIDGLTENFCSSLFIDSKQTLWVGHFEGGISFIRNNVIQKISTKNFASAKVISFAEGDNNTLYYATSAGSMYQIINDVITPFIKYDLASINEIKIKNNKLFAATQTGLMYFDLKDKNKTHTILVGTENKNITTVDVKNNGDVILGIDGEGVEFYKYYNSHYTLINKISVELNSSRKNIKDISFKNQNEIYISLSGEGIRTFNLNYKYDIIKESSIEEKHGLQNLYITKIFIDNETNLWFGTFGGGLYQYMSDRFEWFNDKNYIPFNDIRTLVIDNTDNVIITNENQLFEFNYKLETKTLITQIIKTDDKDNEIRTTFYNDSTKNLYVGTSNELMVFKKNSNTYKLINTLKEFNGKSINYITKNKFNQLYICTTTGLFILNANNQIINYYSTDNGLPHNNVTGCFIDKKNNAWLFSPETPLYNLTGDSINMFKEIYAIGALKFNNAVDDRYGNIWIGTDGAGIYKITDNEVSGHYTTKDGLASDFVYSLQITTRGDLVSGHRNGLSIKYYNMKNFKPILKTNGLQSSNINTNTIAKDSKGNLMIGTTEGIIKYNPAADLINDVPPILSLINITFNNKVFTQTDSIYVLPYSNYEVKVDFIGVSLLNPKEVTYKYKLEGFNSNWQITSEQFILFPKLDDGEYALTVYATNSDGFQSTPPLILKIIVKKPFWKNVWFFILCFIILFGILYFMHRIRTVALRKTKIELEKIVNTKTRELVFEKERVEKVNELLEYKNQNITSSILYAQGIQSAILPSFEAIAKNLNTFVFYRAVDIVSGDFYWYYETENYFYVAAVDCTGHGVPGAFMSLLGGTYLEQIMIENNEPLPSKIINLLDEKLFHSFNKGEQSKLIRDGMDMVLCQISKHNLSFVISNASRPICLVLNSQFIDVKATNVSVGGASSLSSKVFVDYTYTHQKDDVIYLFSDGFSDQFGGEKNKRYSTKRLKEFIHSISHLDINEQSKRVETEFDSWKGINHQTDDVLVIGIKLRG